MIGGRALHHRLDGRVIRDVHCGDAGEAFVGHKCGHLFRAGGVDVGEHQVPAVACQGLGDAFAEKAGRTGDQGRRHVRLPLNAAGCRR